MTKRIFRSICLVALAVFLASMVLIMGVLYEYFSDVQQAQLKMQTGLAAQGLDHEGLAFFRNFEVSDYRITWIAADGTVLYDSELNTAYMENHLEREEVVDALAKGCGESRRYSATLMERLLYSAQRLSDGTILRLSISQNSILTLLMGMTQPICMIFGIALVVSVSLAIQISKSIVKPINQMDLDNPMSNEGYDELAPFLRRIDSQQKQLRWQEAELYQMQKEISTIIGSMNEGMVLLNRRGKIISINSAAKRLLGAPPECIGEDMLSLCRNLDLQEILFKALEGEAGERRIELCGESYQIDANPITAENTTGGVALFFFNVTQKERAERLRREFTANVSHELKTPLHAIAGSAELLANGMVKDADRMDFYLRIQGEAQRMIHLVEDIIRLSHLDEGAGDMKREETELYALAEDTVKILQAEMRRDDIAVVLHGEPAVIYGIPQLLQSIIYNLCDNAIKYNRPGGSVTVSVLERDNEVLLTVADTGIGIPLEHQARIFERFYRVDRSRSKELGGTGLGLSIVKHAARLHDAAIDLHSAVGEGTEITIHFPSRSCSAR